MIRIALRRIGNVSLDASRRRRRILQAGFLFISASPWWNLTIACVIIQVDILGLYARKEMGDVIFGFVS